MNNINLTDPPKFSDLSKSDRLTIVYNEIVAHIERLKQSGRLKEGQDLNAVAIASQMMLESGWMVSPLAKRANNFGGLNTGKDWKGPFVTVENDKFTGKTYHYRKYDTPLEGIRAQVEFYLPDENPAYAKAGVLKAKTPEEHFARVKSVGYAEDANYVSKLTNFVKSTIRPRLKRGGNQENITNWHIENENYRINEKYKDNLNTEEVNEWNRVNEIEEFQRQQASQAMLEYERQARINQLKNTNKQIFEKPELKQNTIKALNLTPLQSNEPFGQTPTSQLILDKVQGSNTEVPSVEILKAEAKKQQQEAKHQKALTEYMAAPVVDQNMQGPIFGQTSMFGQGQLFGVDQKKAGGKIYIKPENKGKFTTKANAAGMGVQAFANKVLGASEGTYPSSTRRQANFARNASKWKRNTGGFLNNTPPDPPIGSFEWYAQLSPEEIKNIQSDLSTLGAEYTAEKKHAEDVTKNALDIGMRLGRNPNVHGYDYDYGDIRGTERIGNQQDWEAINMGWINNPKSWIRNLGSQDQYGNITYEQVWDEETQTYKDRLDSEGNRIPFRSSGLGCIGAVCGIYQTAGAKAAEPYTASGKEILQGDPISIITGNKTLTPEKLKAMGFYSTEKKPGAIGRKRISTDPSSIVAHSFIEGPELEGEDSIIIENPGQLSEGIKTSRYQYPKESTNWYEYLGRLPQIEPKLETAYERYKALKSAERPVSLERPDLNSLSLSRPDDSILNTKGPLVLPVDVIRKTPKKRRIFRKTS